MPPPDLLTRGAFGLFLLCLALLPWSSFPPFPWLHPHAQWSDAVFAAAAVLSMASRWHRPPTPSMRPLHVALGGYLLAASASYAFSERASASQLLGIAGLAGLAVVTADLASYPGPRQRIGRVVGVTSLFVAAAAAGGVVLFFAGVPSRLVGTYGDLIPGHYARAQAGLYHPNLLASFCIFAAGVVASAEPSRRMRRIALAAQWATVLLTFSRGILGFALAALVRRAHGRHARLVALTATAGVVAVYAALTFNRVSLDPTCPLGARLESQPSSRLQSATSSWTTVVAHPWFGIGPGRPPGVRDGIPFDAHLTPLNVAATMGLPALAAFLAIPVVLWRERRHPTNLPLWGALLGMGVDALAQDIEDFRHLWVLFGLLQAESSREPRERSPSV